MVRVDDAGHLQVDALTEPATAADGAVALPTVLKVVAGWDGTNVQQLSVSAAGDAQVDLQIAGTAVSANAGATDAGTVRVAQGGNATATCADKDVGSGADVEVIAAAAGHTHVLIKVTYAETDGPIQCGMGASSANGFDLLPAPDATHTGSSWEIEGYSGAVNCISASGTVTVNACAW